MQAKNGIAGELVEQAVFEHNPTAVEQFLSRLKNKLQRAVKLPRARQIFRGVQ